MSPFCEIARPSATTLASLVSQGWAVGAVAQTQAEHFPQGSDGEEQHAQHPTAPHHLRFVWPPYVRACMCAVSLSTRKCAPVCACMHACACVHACKRASVPVCMCMRVHVHVHAQMHTRERMRAYAHVHTACAPTHTQHMRAHTRTDLPRRSRIRARSGSLNHACLTVCRHGCMHLHAQACAVYVPPPLPPSLLRPLCLSSRLLGAQQQREASVPLAPLACRRHPTVFLVFRAR